jgi:2-C-methyl-D-erythritol 4-phosphate cytidylyltransferase
MCEGSEAIKAVALILGAGASNRMGRVDKTFVPLSGMPLVLYPVKLFAALPEIEKILVVTAAESVNKVMETARPAAAGKMADAVTGGAERQDSARLGLAALAKYGYADNVVLIHDAARPLTGAALVRRVLGAVPTADGVVPVVPLNDTVKRVDASGVVEATLNREVMRAVQTPQGFILKYILELNERAADEGYYATDDAALVERYGGRVVTVEGDPANIKITSPPDLKIAETILELGISSGSGGVQ